MLGEFTYINPTKIYFGKESLENLEIELKKYGKNILLIYGSGSIKKNGLYDKVINILNNNDKNIIEDSGVMPNPTIKKLYEGLNIARKQKIDLILAVGGGSVIDYAKALSISIYCNDDPWDKYFIKMEDVSNEIVPVGVILTMVGTGSEANGGTVITNEDQKLKIGHVFDERVFPKFAIMNPCLTYTLTKYQMVSGIYDAFSHILEQYLCGEDDNTSDYISEGLMRSLIYSSKVSLKDPYNYEARSNIMWSATLALNTIISKGKSTDWMVHMIGQTIGAYTNATHGMTLSAISMSYYNYIMPYGINKFKKLAQNVFGVREMNNDIEVAKEGLKCLENWMKELELVMNIDDLGVSVDMINKIAKNTIILNGGYKTLNKYEIKEILIKSRKKDKE